MAVSNELLKQFKMSIGDFSDIDELNEYYTNFLEMAKADLISDDISVIQLDSELGKALTILYAKNLMNEKDIATDQTITLLRNKLGTATKGDKYEE